MKNLSLVIPVRNETAAIESLAGEIAQAFDDAKLEWEAIWVDDGSTDGTDETLSHLHTRDARHRYVILKEHSGQSAALFAGFRATQGEILATLDGDGQQDPRDLVGMLELLESQEQMLICGVREARADDARRKFVSRFGNWMLRWASGVQVRDAGCSVRVFRRSVIANMPQWKCTHRFFAAIAGMLGASFIEVPVTHRRRVSGKSKYTIGNRMWVVFWDLLAIRWYRRRVVKAGVRAAVGESNKLYRTET